MSDQEHELEAPEEEAPEVEQEPERAPSSAPVQEGRPGISYRDRVAVFGPTGSGKSVVLNTLFAGYRCQRVLIDTKDEFRIDGVSPVSRPEDIDWTAPVIHVIDDRGDPGEYDRLFRHLQQRRQGRVPGPKHYGLKVCVHELGDLCGDSPQRAGTYVVGYWRKGRAHGQGADGGSQRPVNIPKVARTEVEHVIVMEREFDPDDRATVAAALGIGEAQLLELQAQARQHGQYAHIWYPKLERPKKLYIRPPLPEQVLARGMVHGLD